MLTPAQVEQYRELGYLVVPDVLGRELLAEVKRRADAIVADAAKITAHTDVYDLEDSHSAQEPRVRRIKTPHKHFPFFTELTRNPAPAVTQVSRKLRGVRPASPATDGVLVRGLYLFNPKQQEVVVDYFRNLVGSPFFKLDPNNQKLANKVEESKAKLTANPSPVNSPLPQPKASPSAQSTQ